MQGAGGKRVQSFFKQVIINIDRSVKAGKGRMRVTGSQRMEELQYLENYLGGGHKIMRLVLLVVMRRFRMWPPGWVVNVGRGYDHWAGETCVLDESVCG